MGICGILLMAGIFLIDHFQVENNNVHLPYYTFAIVALAVYAMLRFSYDRLLEKIVVTESEVLAMAGRRILLRSPLTDIQQVTLRYSENARSYGSPLRERYNITARVETPSGAFTFSNQLGNFRELLQTLRQHARQTGHEGTLPDSL